MVTRLKDVAALAGVSICTVSKLLNGAPGAAAYSKACAERVWSAARQLGYQPNYHARSLQTGKSQAVGIVLGGPSPDEAEDSSGWFLSAMLASVDMAARGRGYHSVVIGPRDGQTAVDCGMRFLLERRVDSLIVPGFFCETAEQLRQLEETRLPVVMLHFQQETSLPVVEVDAAVGMREVADHLAAFGHRRVIWMGPERFCPSYPVERRDAFLEAAHERGIETCELGLALPENLGRAHLLDEITRARDLLLRHLPGDSSSTAVVCYHETMAFGAYAALNELGWRIPRDLSIVGFDDVRATLAYPPMTVVSHMLNEASDRAVACAVEMSASQESWEKMRHRRERIPSRLVVRASTGPARNGKG